MMFFYLFFLLRLSCFFVIFVRVSRFNLVIRFVNKIKRMLVSLEKWNYKFNKIL